MDAANSPILLFPLSWKVNRAYWYFKSEARRASP